MSIRPLYGDGGRFYALIGRKWRYLQCTGRYRYQQSGKNYTALHHYGFQLDIRIGK